MCRGCKDCLAQPQDKSAVCNSDRGHRREDTARLLQGALTGHMAHVKFRLYTRELFCNQEASQTLEQDPREAVQPPSLGMVRAQLAKP